jgi:hypothetical protein
MDTFRDLLMPAFLGTAGTGATYYLSNYGLPWIAATCGVLTIVYYVLSIIKLTKK